MKEKCLGDCRTQDIESVMGFLEGEVESCDSDHICPEERPVFVALIRVLDIELRIRNPRRKMCAFLQREAAK